MSKNVLVIERDFETSRQIATALEAQGYFVFTASGAEAGLVMARRVKPSLLFLNLPRSAGGVEFLKKLRGIDFLNNVPILLITQRQEEYETKYGEMYGIVNFVSLPINEAEVVAKSKASLEQIPGINGISSHMDSVGNMDASGEGGGALSQERAITAYGYPGPGANDGKMPSGEDIRETVADPKSDSTVLENENLIVRIDDGAGEFRVKAEHAPHGAAFSGGLPAGAMAEDAAPGEERQSLLFESKESEREKETPPASFAGSEGHVSKADEDGTEKENENENEKGPGQWKGGMEDMMPSAFHGQKKKKGAMKKSKGLLWMVAIVLLGAVSSFLFFKYMAPGPGGAGKNKNILPAANAAQAIIKTKVKSPAPAPAPAAQAAGRTLAASAQVKGPVSALKPVTGNKKAVPVFVVSARAVKKAPNAQPARPAVRAVQAHEKRVPARPAHVKAKEKKSAGYWALLEREEAQMKARESKRKKAVGEIKGPAVKAAPAARFRKGANARRFYSLQVGAFSIRANAEKLSARLRAQGFLKAYVEFLASAGRTGKKKKQRPLYRVLVGRFGAPAQGDATRRKLEREGLKAFYYHQ